jgi:hypothetical protein
MDLATDTGQVTATGTGTSTGRRSPAARSRGRTSHKSDVGCTAIQAGRRIGMVAAVSWDRGDRDQIFRFWGVRDAPACAERPRGGDVSHFDPWCSGGYPEPVLRVWLCASQQLSAIAGEHVKDLRSDFLPPALPGSGAGAALEPFRLRGAPWSLLQRPPRISASARPAGLSSLPLPARPFTRDEGLGPGRTAVVWRFPV